MPNSNAWRRTLYRDKIAQLAPAHDPAHVEAYLRVLTEMRLDHTGIRPESMTTHSLEAGVKLAALSIEAFGLDTSDALARSFGLTPRKRK